MTVSKPKSIVQGGPAFDDDREITPEYERDVRSFYGLPARDGESTSYGDYYGDSSAPTTGSTSEGTVGPGTTMGDTERGYFEEHGEGQEGVGRDDDSSDLEDEDELRVQRNEEELRAGTREREAGSVRVRKRVRTDRESIEVPTRREEVEVEDATERGRGL
jgi:stress response protein YsnF